MNRLGQAAAWQHRDTSPPLCSRKIGIPVTTRSSASGAPDGETGLEVGRLCLGQEGLHGLDGCFGRTISSGMIERGQFVYDGVEVAKVTELCLELRASISLDCARVSKEEKP